MKHSPKQYAAALVAVLEKKPKSERKKVLKNFLRLLTVNADHSRLDAILRESEVQYLRKTGTKKVVIRSASKLSSSVRIEVEEILGKKLYIEEKISPRLLAGIQILVNDDTLIDGSAETRLRKLFR